MATPGGEELRKDQLMLRQEVIESVLGQRDDIGRCFGLGVRSRNRGGSSKKAQCPGCEGTHTVEVLERLIWTESENAAGCAVKTVINGQQVLRLWKEDCGL